jgi:hypothetical protein
MVRLMYDDVEGGEFKWEIEPHYSTDWDIYVTNDDGFARHALLEVAEKIWDEIQPGEERIIKIRMR